MLSEVIKTCLTALFSLAALFLLAKLMGNKQVNQMNIFDYIIGISIGSIAADMAIDLEKPHISLTAMVVYGVVAYLISMLSDRFVGVQRVVYGGPTVLLHDGELYPKNFKTARLDLSEFLTMLRTAGWFDLSQIHTAMLEQNGALSVLPKAQCRPLTPEDIRRQPVQEQLPRYVIVNGRTLSENLRLAGKDASWLMRQLHAQNYKSEKQVFLATLDSEDHLSVYPCE